MKKQFLFFSLLIFVLASAQFVCAQSDLTDMLRTEIASTVVAEIQQTLEADGYVIIPKTQATPAPVNSGISSGTVWGFWKPTPTFYSYQAQLVKQDKNYMHYAHGVQFTVTWTIKNTGPLPWNGDFYLRYVQGQEALDNSNYFPGDIGQGESFTFSRSFEAQETPGIYNSYWELVDDDGVVILDNIWAGWQVDDWRDFQ